MNPGQSQMLLRNSERFALLLAQNLQGNGANRTVVSENIGKRLSNINILTILNDCFACSNCC